MMFQKGEYSLSAIESLWQEEASKLFWFKKWDKVLDWQKPYAKWFIGGQINASYVCADIHVKEGRGDKVAIYWEDEQGVKREITYLQLYQQINRYASVFQNMGVKRGDNVVIYMPMTPEAIFSMLAVARLGAVHSVVFSGFSDQALQGRLQELRASWVITSDWGIRRGKQICLKSIVKRAVGGLDFVKNVFVVRREQAEGAVVDDTESMSQFVSMQSLLLNACDYVEPVAVDATDPLFILYTSGTTGKPKGVVHSVGGYLTYVHSTMKWAFDVNQETRYWCTADIGWITGHSYSVYGPLMHCVSMLMYEGAPDFPSTSRWWELIEKYKISTFYTAPTAIRMLRQFGEEIIKKHDLSCLRMLGCVGEPINPQVWEWFKEFVGAGRCPIIDTWWQTETGGFMISPAAGINLVKLKPGSVTYPMPGIETEIVDETGCPVPDGVKGHLIIKKPWPGMFSGIYNDAERYNKYFTQFGGFYYSGDYAIRDSDGYFWVLGRADDVLNIAGHRVGTAEVENAVISHSAVVEAAAIGVPDDIKGEALVVFVTLHTGIIASDVVKKEIIAAVRAHIGAFVTPSNVYFVEKLPKTRSGKIMRRVLKAIAQDSSVGDVTTCEDESSVEEIKLAYASLKSVLLGSRVQHEI